MKTTASDMVFESADALGEGPMWHAGEQRLYWVDLLAKKLHRGDPATGRIDSRSLPYAASRVTPASDGRLLVSFLRRPALGRFEGDAFETLDLGDAVADKHRFNDGACDSHGRFWTANYDETLKAASGRIVCFDRGQAERKLDGVMLPNGIRFSPDEKTMLFVDSWPGRVWAFAFDVVSAHLGERRLLIDFEGSGAKPDGCAMDAEGCLWIAEVNRSRVARYTPEGRLDSVVTVPTSKPTSVSFGGADRRTLYITSRVDGLTPEQRAVEPQAGAVFAARVSTAGQPEHAYQI